VNENIYLLLRETESIIYSMLHIADYVLNNGTFNGDETDVRCIGVSLSPSIQSVTLSDNSAHYHCFHREG
jgi:hypothetical protein